MDLQAILVNRGNVQRMVTQKNTLHVSDRWIASYQMKICKKKKKISRVTTRVGLVLNKGRYINVSVCKYLLLSPAELYTCGSLKLLFSVTYIISSKLIKYFLEYQSEIIVFILIPYAQQTFLPFLSYITNTDKFILLNTHSLFAAILLYSWIFCNSYFVGKL